MITTALRLGEAVRGLWNDMRDSAYLRRALRETDSPLESADDSVPLKPGTLCIA
ncbi:hypothetical protein M2390_002006 [Mycetocola sp. BIGb0189]|uniref:hypothetical protein n=1 Tax=Mycetocola sp. BIGb0189 TaxID=2940604 RepID=UPI00216A8220|nr:hypothetical protein [Mycetocola sp. BIGb0189]MCS4276812.1 hypothetical protein [Mycetocola sp. BIGb0189]